MRPSLSTCENSDSKTRLCSSLDEEILKTGSELRDTKSSKKGKKPENSKSISLVMWIAGAEEDGPESTWESD